MIRSTAVMSRKTFQFVVVMLLGAGLLGSAVPRCCCASAAVEAETPEAPSGHGCCSDEASPAPPVSGATEGGHDGCDNAGGCEDPIQVSCSVEDAAATVHKPAFPEKSKSLGGVVAVLTDSSTGEDAFAGASLPAQSRASPIGKHSIIILKSSLLL